MHQAFAMHGPMRHLGTSTIFLGLTHPWPNEAKKKTYHTSTHALFMSSSLRGGVAVPQRGTDIPLPGHAMVLA